MSTTKYVFFFLRNKKNINNFWIEKSILSRAIETGKKKQNPDNQEPQLQIRGVSKPEFFLFPSGNVCCGAHYRGIVLDKFGIIFLISP